MTLNAPCGACESSARDQGGRFRSNGLVGRVCTRSFAAGPNDAWNSGTQVVSDSGLLLWQLDGHAVQRIIGWFVRPAAVLCDLVADLLESVAVVGVGDDVSRHRLLRGTGSSAGQRDFCERRRHFAPIFAPVDHPQSTDVVQLGFSGVRNEYVVADSQCSVCHVPVPCPILESKSMQWFRVVFIDIKVSVLVDLNFAAHLNG